MLQITAYEALAKVTETISKFQFAWYVILSEAKNLDVEILHCVQDDKTTGFEITLKARGSYKSREKVAAEKILLQGSICAQRDGSK